MSDDKFPGFPSPEENWSKLPHQLIEALPDFSSLAELKVVLYILRHTWGYQEFGEFKRITLDEFQHGRRRKDRSRLDSGIGMSENAIMDGLDRAIKHGFIIQSKDSRHRPGRPAHIYQLKEYSSEVEGKEMNKPQKLRVQSSEVAHTSEKDTIERNSKREKDTLLSSSEKPDPLLFGLERQTLENNEGNYAIPAHAGGADALAGAALFALYAERGKKPPRKGTKQWQRQRSKVAEALKAYGYEQAPLGLVEKAAKLLCERKGDWTNVFYPSFPMDFGQALSDAEGVSASRHTAPRHQPENALLSQEALRERQAAQPILPQDDVMGANIKDLIQAHVTRPTFVQYVKPCRFTCDDGALVITAPDANKRDWLENRLGATIKQALVGVTDGPKEVVFEVDKEVIRG